MTYTGWYAIKPNQTKPNHIHLIFMYTKDLALNDLQWLICAKTKSNLSWHGLNHRQNQQIHVFTLLSTDPFFFYFTMSFSVDVVTRSIRTVFFKILIKYKHPCLVSLVRQMPLVWFVGLYGISTFVGYLTPNPFLYK